MQRRTAPSVTRQSLPARRIVGRGVLLQATLHRILRRSGRGMTRTRGLLSLVGARRVGLLGALTGASLLLYATCIEHRRLRLVRRPVPIVQLPAALNGLRILHLSDLHVGALHSGARHLARAARL